MRNLRRSELIRLAEDSARSMGPPGYEQTISWFREACIRCPVLRPDPEQLPGLEEIRANLLVRLQEAKEQGWLGEVTAIEASLAAAEQKLGAMRDLAARAPPSTSACPTSVAPSRASTPSSETRMRSRSAED